MGRTEFHRLADRELNEAAEYYELESPALGVFILECGRLLGWPELAARTSRRRLRTQYSAASRLNSVAISSASSL